MSLRNWFRERRRAREARRLLNLAFRSPELLKKTSLKPRHRGRWILVNYEMEGGHVARIWFGILRHPRPYRFSRQSHQVIEYYLFDVLESRITVLRGINITRRQGRDAN